MRVWTWRDRYDAPGGWVSGAFAVAAEDAAGLRSACLRARVPRPSRAARARHDDDVVQIALAHPGQVLFRSTEPGRRTDPHWHVLVPR